ncbi:MAG: hypothetical protein QNJ23_08800 [Woeseiaceae bacterium]|nr:hypothetical protein [Woeseiaceae bacterium]
MNKKALLLVPLGLAIAGCATTNGYGEQPQPAACIVPDPIEGPCNGNPANPKVNLNLNTMKASPPNVCANPGTTIEIKLSPPPRMTGTVSVVAKNKTNTWLNGTNAPDPRKIFIYVPGWIAPGDDYYYGFTTSLGTCVDPRVDIITRVASLETAEQSE